jgi:hypothetical protein
MKVGDKVVCIYDQWAFPGPAKDEICEIESMHKGIFGYTFLILVGHTAEFPDGGRVDYNSLHFRPVDYGFGEQVAEQIEKEIEKITEPQLA